MRRDDVGAEPIVDGVRYRDGVAVAVDDRVVRRMHAFMHRKARREIGRAQRAVSNARALLQDVRLIEQLRDRVAHEIGIAEVGVAVHERQPLGLDDVVRSVGRPRSERGEGNALEDSEHLA